MRMHGKKHRTVAERVKDTRWSHHPQTRDEALEQDIVFFDPVPPVGCKKHNRRIVLIYTATEIPKCCAEYQARESYELAKAALAPLSRIQAIDEGVDYYWTEFPARYCGHVGKLHISGCCYICGAGGGK